MSKDWKAIVACRICDKLTLIYEGENRTDLCRACYAQKTSKLIARLYTGGNKPDYDRTGRHVEPRESPRKSGLSSPQTK